MIKDCNIRQTEEESEDINEAIRIRKSKKGRHICGHLWHIGNNQKTAGEFASSPCPLEERNLPSDEKWQRRIIDF